MPHGVLLIQKQSKVKCLKPKLGFFACHQVNYMLYYIWLFQIHITRAYSLVLVRVGRMIESLEVKTKGGI
jgi:hypothetical protein